MLPNYYLRTPHSQAFLHPLKALAICLVHFHIPQFDPVLLQLHLELRRVEHAVAPPCLDNMRLFFQTEVRPCEAGIDDLSEKGQYFIVRDRAWVSEIVYPRCAVCCKQ